MTDNRAGSKTYSSDAKASQTQTEQAALWGKQTALSLKYFAIGKEHFPPDFIFALVYIKKFAAQVNYANGHLSADGLEAITIACRAILSGRHNKQFPLSVWQTGSGTQTNMNVNEVICALANQHLSTHRACDLHLHPNDHINMSQSSNDVFPSAMHVVAAQQTHVHLLPHLDKMIHCLEAKQDAFQDTYMVGRTHLMDAVPISAGAMFSAYATQLRDAKQHILDVLPSVYRLALGGTAVGSGCNADENFGVLVAEKLAEQYQLPFVQHENLYAAVSGEDSLSRLSAACKQVSEVLLKMANDIRLLGSGPRCGIHELLLPANEPGSSIMPGKVNPTQCEALSMICLQVQGNDLSISLAASQGQLQLNTYRPLIIHNMLMSLNILSDGIASFTENCLKGLSLNSARIAEHMHDNLSVITLLAPKMGYDTATKIVKHAQQANLALSEAAEALGIYQREEFQTLLDAALKG